MKRKIYQKRKFYTYETTNYICPECSIGKLHINQKSIKHIEYKNYNRKISGMDDFDIDFLMFGFYGYLYCDNNKCGEKIVFAGKLNPCCGSYENQLGECEEIDEQIITIEYIERPPLIIALRDIYPKEINKILYESFRLFWLDHNSCANKIRICLEILMDKLKIKKYHNRKGKRYDLTLHARINIFGEKDPFLNKILTSIKIIGNSGSHDNTLTINDVLDGYYLTEYALKKIYINEENEIKKIATTITKRNKPRSKKL